MFVSHDRYFIDELASRVFEVADGTLTVYAGNYESYLRQKEGAALAAEAAEAEAEADSIDTESEPESEPVAPAKRMNPIKQRQMEERRESIEEEVARLEAAMAETEGELAVFKSAEETQRLTDLLDLQRRDLESLTEEWETITQTIDTL